MKAPDIGVNCLKNVVIHDVEIINQWWYLMRIKHALIRSRSLFFMYLQRQATKLENPGFWITIKVIKLLNDNEKIQSYSYFLLNSLKYSSILALIFKQKLPRQIVATRLQNANQNQGKALMRKLYCMKITWTIIKVCIIMTQHHWKPSTNAFKTWYTLSP